MSTLEERFAELARDKPSVRAVDLARATGVSRTAAGKWLKGQTSEIETRHVFKVARLYDVNAEWLGTGDGLKKRSDSNKQIPHRRLALLQAYGSLPDEVREHVRAIIETLHQLHNAKYQKWERDVAEITSKAKRETIT